MCNLPPSVTLNLTYGRFCHFSICYLLDINYTTSLSRLLPNRHNDESILYFIGRKKRSPQTADGAPPPVGAPPPPSAPPINQCTATKNGITKYCKFPFTYTSKGGNKRTYYECTNTDSTTGVWCATQVKRDGITADGNSYVDCDPGCGNFILIP